jgi:hypothetical protein
MPSANDFRAALSKQFQQAEAKGGAYLEVRAGDFHKSLGGYPGPAHQMPTCCEVLRMEMTVADKIVESPPRGRGASLTIRFSLPRGPKAAVTITARETKKTDGRPKSTRLSTSRKMAATKPPLSVTVLVEGGFELFGQWTLSNKGDLKLDRPFPRAVGVYAFVKNANALYVGVATMGLSQRLYSYTRPGASQITNIRLNAAIKNELLKGPIEI